MMSLYAVDLIFIVRSCGCLAVLKYIYSTVAADKWCCAVKGLVRDSLPGWEA